MTVAADRAGGGSPRVLMIAATPYFADRGCHVRIQGEALGLERLGADVTVATYGGLGRDVAGGRIVRAPGLPGYRRLDAAPAFGKLLLDGFLLLSALRRARSTRPDVIHAHTQEGGLIGLAIGRLLGIPVVVDLQSRRVAEELAHYGQSGEGGRLFRIADWFDHYIPRSAAAVITSTDEIARFVRTEAAPLGPVEVLADAIDVGVEVAKADPTLAHELGIDPNRPVVVYLGLLTEAQGIDLLIDVAARLEGRGQGIQFLILGYPEAERWQAQAQRRGVTSMRFPGRVPFEQAGRYLALGTLAVSAKRSTTEGNGKLLNYMAGRLPVLALDTTVNRAILGPEALYAADDAGAWADAIVQALADLPRLAHLGRRLGERVRHQASWDRRARQLLDLYRRVGAV